MMNCASITTRESICHKIVIFILQNSHRHDGELVQAAAMPNPLHRVDPLWQLPGGAFELPASLAPRILSRLSRQLDGDCRPHTDFPPNMVRTDFSAQSECRAGFMDSFEPSKRNRSSRNLVGVESREGWQGTWTARTPNGQPFSGTWTSDLADFSGKTFQEMLERTVVREVAGSWRTGRQHGNWWPKR